MRGEGGKYQKISPIEMYLFMVGGEGLIEIGTKSLSLLFFLKASLSEPSSMGNARDHHECCHVGGMEDQG